MWGLIRFLLAHTCWIPDRIFRTYRTVEEATLWVLDVDCTYTVLLTFLLYWWVFLKLSLVCHLNNIMNMCWRLPSCTFSCFLTGSGWLTTLCYRCDIWLTSKLFIPGYKGIDTACLKSSCNYVSTNIGSLVSKACIITQKSTSSFFSRTKCGFWMLKLLFMLFCHQKLALLSSKIEFAFVQIVFFRLMWWQVELIKSRQGRLRASFLTISITAPYTAYDIASRCFSHSFWTTSADDKSAVQW